MIRTKLFLRTFICCRCARIWKSSRPLLTPKTRLLMIFTPRIDSVIHTFSSNIFAIADKILQGYPRRRTAYTFPFRCHKSGHRNSLHAIQHVPTRVFRGLSFFVSCLWLPVVRQGVVCFHSVGLGCSWIFTAIVFNDPCGSTLSVSMYISYLPRFFPSAICLSGTCGEFFI